MTGTSGGTNDDQRLIIFLDQVNELSSYITESTNFLPELEGFLFSAALTINASAGLILIKHERFEACHHFGLDDEVAQRITDDFKRKRIFKDIHLAGAIHEIVDISVHNLSDGLNHYGFLVFINKETRDGVDFFNEFDHSLISILSNQLCMATSKLASHLEQNELITLNEKILNAGSNAVMAVNQKQEILFANRKMESLLEFEFVKLKLLSSIIPAQSQAGIFVSEAIKLNIEVYSESLLLSAVNPKVLSIQVSPFTIEVLDGNDIMAYVITIQDTSEISHLKKTFSKYVSDDVLALTMSSGNKMRLGGVRKPCAILFCDIRGFTSFSEVREPEDVVETLNQYFNAMMSVIKENGGSIDKLIGDEIMAVFNHNEDDIHPSFRAVKTAYEMKSRLELFNSLRTEQGEQLLYFGIGIHYGDVIAGNIGSFDRMDYTIIGDNVNTAARFCSFARPEEIIISDTVYDEIADYFRCEKMKPIELKGKSKALNVYRVIEKNN